MFSFWSSLNIIKHIESVQNMYGRIRMMAGSKGNTAEFNYAKYKILKMVLLFKFGKYLLWHCFFTIVFCFIILLIICNSVNNSNNNNNDNEYFYSGLIIFVGVTYRSSSVSVQIATDIKGFLFLNYSKTDTNWIIKKVCRAFSVNNILNILLYTFNMKIYKMTRKEM